MQSKDIEKVWRFSLQSSMERKVFCSNP